MDETQPPTDDDILLLTPTERRKKGIAPSEVTEALVETMVSGGREDKVIEGATLPEISLEHRSVSGRTNHPVVFRDCAIGHVSAEHATFKYPY
ncbi:MAG: hypothetical protein SV760_01745 [Halobacteria archaeon]|nr:hypothetical protein [Halobacteria archaeon]